MSKIKELIDTEINRGFGKNHELIQQLVSPAVGIKLRTKINSEIQPLASDTYLIKSKIGGFPDMEHDIVYPIVDDKPLTFLCQINLNEIYPFITDLPQSGVLYFFVANDETDSYTALKNNIRVIFVENNMLKHKFNILSCNQLSEYKVDFYEDYTLPSYQEEIIISNAFYTEISEELEDLEVYISELTYGDENYIKHHILGHPNAVQGSVRMY